MKKGDKITIICAAFSVILSAVCIVVLKEPGSTVTVKQNNKTVYTGSLKKDATVLLDTNTVVIKDKSVYMSDAVCKNQVCVNTGKISKKGESIICLPNKVTVEIN